MESKAGLYARYQVGLANKNPEPSVSELKAALIKAREALRATNDWGLDDYHGKHEDKCAVSNLIDEALTSINSVLGE